MSAKKLCPAYADGVCRREHAVDGAAHCRTFRCGDCKQAVSWCYGGDGEQCDGCYALSCTPSDPRAYVS